jgi:DNA-binding NarL/FixJ family response regulator
MGRTVVIVDDHAGFRRLAARLIAACGYEVIGEAADGAGAIDAVRRLRPDLLLLDVQLPDIDGFAVASALGRETSVVLTSSREADDYLEQLAQTSACGFISKRHLTGAAIAELTGCR